MPTLRLFGIRHNPQTDNIQGIHDKYNYFPGNYNTQKISINLKIRLQPTNILLIKYIIA